MKNTFFVFYCVLIIDGDLAHSASALDAYMKQKHRLIWQRRNPEKDIVGLEKRKELKAQAEQDLKKFINFKH